MAADDQSEYEAYVQHLYRTNISPAVGQQTARGPHRFHREEEFDFPLSLLARTDAAIKLVTATSHIYRAFRPEFLSQTLSDAADGVRANSRALDQLGFADVLDSEYLVLAKGIRSDRIPPGEAELLRRLGFSDAADNLSGLIYMVREHAAISASRNRIERPSAHMRDLGELLDRAAEDHRRLGEIEEELAMLRRNSDVPTEGPRQQLDEEEAAKRKPRRWWKGIGQIVQGAGISLGDAAVAAGFGAAGVAPAWAALVSVTVGVGTIMAAIGDLRDE